jgi:hypothetical protein
MIKREELRDWGKETPRDVNESFELLETNETITKRNISYSNLNENTERPNDENTQD